MKLVAAITLVLLQASLHSCRTHRSDSLAFDNLNAPVVSPQKFTSKLLSNIPAKLAQIIPILQGIDSPDAKITKIKKLIPVYNKLNKWKISNGNQLVKIIPYKKKTKHLAYILAGRKAFVNILRNTTNFSGDSDSNESRSSDNSEFSDSNESRSSDNSEFSDYNESRSSDNSESISFDSEITEDSKEPAISQHNSTKLSQSTAHHTKQPHNSNTSNTDQSAHSKNPLHVFYKTNHTTYGPYIEGNTVGTHNQHSHYLNHTKLKHYDTVSNETDSKSSEFEFDSNLDFNKTDFQSSESSFESNGYDHSENSSYTIYNLSTAPRPYKEDNNTMELLFRRSDVANMSKYGLHYSESLEEDNPAKQWQVEQKVQQAASQPTDVSETEKSGYGSNKSDSESNDAVSVFFDSESVTESSESNSELSVFDSDSNSDSSEIDSNLDSSEFNFQSVSDLESSKSNSDSDLESYESSSDCKSNEHGLNSVSKSCEGNLEANKSGSDSDYNSKESSESASRSDESSESDLESSETYSESSDSNPDSASESTESESNESTEVRSDTQQINHSKHHHHENNDDGEPKVDFSKNVCTHITHTDPSFPGKKIKTKMSRGRKTYNLSVIFYR